MRILLWITIFAHGTLRLRGDGDATRTLSFSNRGQRRMQSSEDAPREPLDDLNLFRRDSYQSGHDNEEESTTTDYYSRSHDAEQVAESEPSSGKGKGKSSKDSGKGKGKSSSSKSLKSSKKDKLASKKKSKSSHSFKKKKHGKGHMNHVSGKGKGHTSAPSASHHHSSKSHISGKGKGSETSSPASSPHSSLSRSPVSFPSPPSPSLNSPNVTLTPPTASGPTASPSVAPTPAGETLQLSDFVLAYVFERDDVPSDSDVQAAVTVTRTYLNGFSKQRLGELKELDTRKSFAESSEPPSSYQIGFESTAFFVAGTDPLPTVGEMDLLTTLAFSGENLRTYLELLGQLPEDNIFSTTSDVYDSIPRNDDAVARKSNVAIGASASAGAFIALLIGVAFYRKRSSYVDLDKLAYDGQHITVAGETYVGGSTMYSSSGVGNRVHQTHMCDDTQSIWGISTKAGTEDCASEGGQSMEFGEDTLEHQLGDLSSYEHLIGLGEEVRDENSIYHHDPLAPAHLDVDPYSSDNESKRSRGSSRSAEHAEDADVPLRVVDLIRRFSPLSR